MEQVKEINIKSAYYYFDYMIDIRSFPFKLIKNRQEVA